MMKYMTIADRVLQRLVSARADSGPPVPTGSRAFTAPMTMPWHVRTLILPIPDGEMIRVLFVNLVVGRVGMAGFDDEPATSRPENECHLTVLTLGREQSLCEAFVFDRRDSLREQKGRGFEIEPGRFRYWAAGSWPKISSGLEIPEWGLRLGLETGCRAPVVWWNNTHPLYSHYSAFGRTRGTVEIGAREQAIDGWISLEHGMGMNLQKWPGRPTMPASMFHYQLGALASGEVFALGCFSAMGIEVFRRGVLIATNGRRHPIDSWWMEDADVVDLDDRCGGTVFVPRDFRMHARSSSLSLDYGVETLAAPIAGTGRLTSSGAELSGKLRLTGDEEKEVSGSIYIEHLHRKGVPPVP